MFISEHTEITKNLLNNFFDIYSLENSCQKKDWYLEIDISKKEYHNKKEQISFFYFLNQMITKKKLTTLNMDVNDKYFTRIDLRKSIDNLFPLFQYFILGTYFYDSPKYLNVNYEIKNGELLSTFNIKEIIKDKKFLKKKSVKLIGRNIKKTIKHSLLTDKTYQGNIFEDSHAGLLSIMHSMKQSQDYSDKITITRIINNLILQYYICLEDIIINYHQPEIGKISLLHLGIIFHTIQDSFSPSHINRKDSIHFQNITKYIGGNQSNDIRSNYLDDKISLYVPVNNFINRFLQYYEKHKFLSDKKIDKIKLLKIINDFIIIDNNDIIKDLFINKTTLFLKTFNELYIYKSKKYNMKLMKGVFLKKDGSSIKKTNQKYATQKVYYYGSQNTFNHLLQDYFWKNINKNDIFKYMYYCLYLVLKKYYEDVYDIIKNMSTDIESYRKKDIHYLKNYLVDFKVLLISKIYLVKGL